MKNGFTLIELLGTIMLLGVIALIIFPIANGAIKESKEKAYQVQVSAIIEASHKWGANNTHLLPEENTDVVYNLTLDQLITGGYIEDSKDIKDPRTNEVMDGCVSIKYGSNNNQYIYEYQDKDYCGELPPQVAITIKGEKNEKGWLNEDFYVLISGHGDVFKYCTAVDSECTPDVEITNNVLGAKSLFINTETGFSDEAYKITESAHICAQSFSDGKESSIQCVNYKLDKTDPFFFVEKYYSYRYIINDVLSADEDVDLDGDGDIDSDDKIYVTKKLGSKTNGWYNRPVSVGLAKGDDLSGIDHNKVILTVNGKKIKMSNEDNLLYGDATGDGKINSGDAVCIAQFIEGGFDCKGIKNELADINRDGNIDSIDQTIVAQQLAGWSFSAPYYTIYENGENITYTIQVVDQAGNKVFETNQISIDTEKPTKPLIQGGGEYENMQTISIKTPSTDSLSGLDYYEYYITNEEGDPSYYKKSVTGVTTGTVVITEGYQNHKIYYRAVDKAGNRSEWSDPEKVHVNKLEGDFDFAVSNYNFSISQVNCLIGSDNCDNYTIKFSKGSREFNDVMYFGTKIEEGKPQSLSSGNDIYTIVLYTNDNGIDKLIKGKKVYLHYTGSKASSHIDVSVVLDNVNAIGVAKTSSGIIEAKFENKFLNVSLWGGSGNTNTSSVSSCPSGGSDTYKLRNGICSFSGTGVNEYEKQADGSYENIYNSDYVQCGRNGKKIWRCNSKDEEFQKQNGQDKISVPCWGTCVANPIVSTYKITPYDYTFGVEVK